MTTLKNLLEEVKLGNEVFEETNKSVYFNETVDNDYNIFLVSKVLFDKVQNVENEKLVENIKSIAHKFSTVEERLLEGKSLTKPYGMMKADSIVKSYNEMMELLSEDRKLFNKSDKRELADIFASIKVGVENICEDVSYNHKEFSKAYGVLENYIESSVDLILESVK